MEHMDYDISLVIGSIVLAVIICFFAISLEQLIFKQRYERYQTLILIVSGLLLGLAIWSMHFLGMLACHLPGDYHFDPGLTLFSYIIAFITSTFAVWLTTRESLPIARLILGSVLMGLGIAGMHYTGMMGLILHQYELHYEPLMVIFSVLIGVSGSGLAFSLIFKYKNATKNRILIQIAAAIAMALAIVGLHYTGMSATFFSQQGVTSSLSLYQAGHGLFLFTMIFITSLVLVAGYCIAVLEFRLEERNKALLKLNRELANLAVLDNLTKLPNRLFLMDYVKDRFSKTHPKDEKIAFLYLDLDRFKSVNDAFGHHVGDQLLIQVANRIQKHLDEHCKLLRIGGDEFLIIIEKRRTRQIAQIAEDVLRQVQEAYLITSKEINISASIGIAIYPEHGNNMQDLLINADIAMVMAKDQGRNTYSIFNYTSEHNETRSQSKLINDLYKAVEEQQFVLFYQAKYAANLNICGVEALIRWQHPTFGLLSPHMFIDGAEKTGLIIPMGYWALEQACKQIQIWEATQTVLYPIAVNLSAIQFENKHLVGTLEKLIRKYQIRPNHLIIEITESTAMRHIDSSIATFEQMRALGIQIAIDDFGTGHSSFLYLKDLPVDELKIDRGFIIHLHEGSKEEVILESIIHLATKLGLKVTAEGVETQLQADILIRLGCQQLQGYLLGRPVPVEQLVQ